MKKFFSFLFALTWLITSCTNIGSTVGASKIVTDALGRQVTLNSEPSKIVIVGKQAPMLTNFLYLFKTADQKLIALEKRAQSTEDYLKLVDANIENKYLLEKGAGAEQIVPLNPDVVILKSSMRNSIGKPLEDLSIPVIYVEFENVEQIYRDIRIFADVLNEKKRGEDLISNYQELFQQIHKEVAKNNDSVKSSVLILQAVTSDQKYVFSVPAANWLQTDLIEKAGGIPVWKDANQAGGWTDINMEQISAWDPEVILIVNYQGSALEIVNKLRNDEIWQNLKSVKNDKIYAFPYDYLSWDQPDPRWILGYGWIAYRLNPENLTSPVIHSLINNFYEKFFNLEKSVIKEKINSRIAEYLK
ncbi:MAG: ABC transporter substrate-binding protein [Pelolinea sp.]|nr:ABC transporter substrate-binding protein [Pelolinea sp.]